MTLVLLLWRRHVIAPKIWSSCNNFFLVRIKFGYPQIPFNFFVNTTFLYSRFFSPFFYFFPNSFCFVLVCILANYELCGVFPWMIVHLVSISLYFVLELFSPPYVGVCNKDSSCCTYSLTLRLERSSPTLSVAQPIPHGNLLFFPIRRDEKISLAGGGCRDGVWDRTKKNTLNKTHLHTLPHRQEEWTLSLGLFLMVDSLRRKSIRSIRLGCKTVS